VRDESRYAGGALPPITWTEESEDHIARHGVTPEEVQEALYTRPRWITPGRSETTLVFAMTGAGRCLLVGIGRDADMTTADLDALREHYDNTNTSAELEDAELETTIVAEPMVGITIRLPASTLDAARVIARRDGIKVTALLRRWIEQNVAEGADDEQMVPVAELKRLIARTARDRRAG
jgi:hypothetical protein